MTRGISERELMLTDFERLGDDIKRLKMEKNILIREQGEEVEKLSKLRGEQIEIERNNKKKISEAEKKAQLIIDNAGVIEGKAKEKDTSAVNKMAEALALEKKANDLIKSNEGREKNLAIERESVADLKERLESVVDWIKKAL